MQQAKRSPVAEHVQADIAGDARNPVEGRAGLHGQFLEALVHQEDQRELIRPATVQKGREALLAGGGREYVREGGWLSVWYVDCTVRSRKMLVDHEDHFEVWA